MNKSSSTKPTNAELEILQVLWQHGPSTVRFVNDLLNKEKDVGYTTTLKLMQIMHEKGLVSRTKSGKTHIYTAQLSQEATQQQLVDKLLDTVFQGSAMNLVMQALGNRPSSQEEIQEIREFLDQLEAQQNQKGGKR
ncbi:MAG: BlaI/MecI/CopY family transcriptional regulator [Bacteroidetes bacterium]|nr:MAG: BlaI/MecI/CopY family transcriptional regulator [Bacteroidota bacterium]